MALTPADLAQLTNALKPQFDKMVDKVDKMGDKVDKILQVGTGNPVINQVIQLMLP